MSVHLLIREDSLLCRKVTNAMLTDSFLSVSLWLVLLSVDFSSGIIPKYINMYITAILYRLDRGIFR